MYLTAIFAPFLGCCFAGLGARWLGARGSGVITIVGLGISLLCSLFIWQEVVYANCDVVCGLGSWFQVNTVQVNWTFMFDPLTACIIITVTTVSFCVHVYSLGYIMFDPHFPRFCSYLSLFTGSMLLLVTATDLVTLLVGWEMIGVSSYLLIGFWVTRLSATKAAMKAVLVNRVSDTLLILGLLSSWWYVGSTDFYVLNNAAQVAHYTDFLCLLFLCGALGKSAQVGLHIWLADAMMGPTPVSALIHAATLVTAGIYLIARTSALWECSTFGRTLLVFVGATTSFMAATLGLVQNDVKCVIAYSTCSQLGYMMVALGLSQYGVAIYHLITHACFKALLFLGAGVVIHSSADLQDLRSMGGAHSSLPFAWATLLLGSLSLVGWPFLAGYYSKDQILELAAATPGALGVFSYLFLIFVAAITSTYSFRILSIVFMENPNVRKLEITKPGVPYPISVPLWILGAGSIFWGYVLSDGILGWGTPLWNQSLIFSPATFYSVDSHIMGSLVSFLPFASVFLGMCVAVCFPWPLSFITNKFLKGLYLYFVARWQFDFVFNLKVAAPVLSLGSKTWMLLDKGVLEILGPRGVSSTIYDWAVPTVHRWQTGTVHDYALMFNVLAILGVYVLAYPETWIIPNIVDPHAFVLSILLFLTL